MKVIKNIKLALKLVLAFLWTYVVQKKILRFGEFKSVLYKSALIETYQVDFISIVLPIIEIIMVILILSKRDIIGYYISLLLLFIYTGYLVVLNDFSFYEGCSCGGIFYSLSYQEHLIVNGIFLVLNLGIIFVDESKKTATNNVYSS
jgi:c-di-AMP phosphodiesterase-like protein